MNLDSVKHLLDVMDRAWPDVQKEGEAVMKALHHEEVVTSKEARVRLRGQADRAVKATAKWIGAAQDLTELLEREGG